MSDPTEKIVDIVIPRMGEDNTESELAEWTVRSGDYVQEGMPLAVLNLDKVSVDLEAPATGVVILETSLEQGVVKVGQIVGRIEPPPPADPAHVARHRELLDAIVRAPSDIPARRAYADFLSRIAAPLPPWGAKTTAQRGEYLALVLRLRDPSPGDDVAALTRRRDELAPLGRETARDLVPFTPRGRFVEDGFVVGVGLDVPTLIESHAAFFARAPLHFLYVPLYGADLATGLSMLPRFDSLRMLWLEYPYPTPIPAGVIEHIVTVRAFSAIDTLELQVVFDSLDDVRATLRALPPNISCVDLLRSQIGKEPVSSYETEILAATHARVAFSQRKVRP